MLNSAAFLVVLIHGANLTGASWNLVQQQLTSDQNIKSIAPDLYKADEQITLSQAGQRLCSLIVRYPRPVVLVGHSQGGAIITEAAGQCPTAVHKLIYLTAVFPNPGEGPFDDLSNADDQAYSQCADYDAKSSSMVLKGFDNCWKIFMADTPKSQAETYFNGMRSEPNGIANSKADYVAAKISSIPKYYIETLQDQIISPETQKKIIAKTNFQKVYTLDTSHTPFFSEPKELATILETIY